MLLTPSGRFETNTKVCLSFSAFHPELWQPAWGIRLILEALISFLPTPADGAIGALDYSPKERQRLAKLSLNYKCPTCGLCTDLLPKVQPKCKEATGGGRFAREIQELQRLQQVNEGGTTTTTTTKTKETSDVEGEKEGDLNAKKETANKESAPKTLDTTTITSTTTPLLVDEEGKKEQPATPTNKSNGSELATDTKESPPPVLGVIEEPNANIAIVEPGPPAVPDEAQDEAQPARGFFENLNLDHILQEVEQQQDLSWMYDPLLNLMIILVAVIIYLLAQKAQELILELREIQQQQQ